MNLSDIKGYARVEGVGVVAILSDDIGGLTYVAAWVRSDRLIDRSEFLIDALPEEKDA